MANLSQLRRQRMLAFLEKMREQHKDDDEVLSAINEVENEINEKKYGLVWEEHSEEVEERMVDEIPIFVEDKDKEITMTDNGYNFLLEGDNLHSLHLLEKTHKEKIDVIYIDPPYNTGNEDFIYDDLKIGKDDAFRHSMWLSFMERRLTIAKRLLSERGVIFISIDDNELATLRMLCDNIFGESNFVGCICRATGTTTGQDANKIGSSLDYCLVYSKSSAFELKGIPLSEKDMKRFKDEDENGRYSMLQLRKTGNEDRRENRPKMFYPVTAPDGSSVYPFGPTNYLSRWRVAEETYNNLLAQNMIVWKKKDRYEKVVIDGIESSPWTPYVKYYVSGRTKQVSNLLQEIEGNKKASIDLKNIVGKHVKFDYPKPVEFISLLQKISSYKDSIVLDFFAGSGTTGQAVLELNKEDGGNRHFILCTNNENNICDDVTYPRLQTVITGKRPDGSKYSAGIPADLKYYHTDYIPKKNDNLVNDLIAHIDEMIQLEYGVKIDKEKYISILSDEDADELEKNWANYPNIKAIYISRSVLLTGKQRELFETHDCFTIPDYYFREELREAGEA